MEKELDYMPQTSSRIIKHEIAKRRREEILTSIKIFSITVGLILSSYGLKSGVNKIEENLAIEKDYEEVKKDARTIENNNSYRVLKDSGIRELEYDHSKIALDIESVGKEKGEIYESALIGCILNSLEDNAYKNDDRVIKALNSSQEMEVQTYEEYLHKLGYENEKDYLNATKKELHEEKKRNEIKEKYLEEENPNRGL